MNAPALSTPRRLIILLVLVISAVPAAPAPAAGAQPPAPPAANPVVVDDEQEPVAVPEPSAQALQYYRSGNRLWALAEAWDLVVPAALLFTGLSARVRSLARRIGRGWFFTIGIYVILYLTIVYVLDFPLNYYFGFVRQHAYDLSNQTFGRWFGNSLKGLAVSMVAGFLFAWVPYLLIARSPQRWWLYTALLSVPFLFFVMLVEPIWVDPLFNRFGPMKDKALEQKILALADRAGVAGGRVFEVDKSADTKAVNAYVTGFFCTKRIVLWDTLLAKLDEKGVLFVMGHEMGHYVLGHVVRSILLSSLVTLIGLFWVDRAGRWLIARFGDRFGFDSLADVASLPLLLLLIQLSSLALTPLVFAYSRQQEHEADRFALEITRTNRSGALAFIRLQEENLSIPRPGLLYKLWRSTHPSIGERIDYCNAYHPWRDGRPLSYGSLFRR